MIDSPDAVDSGMEMAGGSPPAEFDISVGPDVLLTAISVTTVVSEKWMKRFVMDLDVLCSDGLASGDDPDEESLEVGRDVCVVTDSMPTVVSMQTVVTEEWMNRFVMDPVECPSVSRTSAVARTFGPAVSEEYSPVVFARGGGRLPMHTPWLSLSQIQREYLSCLLPVVSSRAFFLGKVAFDVAGLGIWPAVSPSGLGGNLTDCDRRASPVGSCSPGRNPVDSSEEGAPVRALIQLSVLGEPLASRNRCLLRNGVRDSDDSRNMGTIRTDALCCVRRRGV